MDRLQQQLKYFVASKISTDTLWQGVKVILSGHETPGEGEHKIMDFIRYERSSPDYDPDTRHCLYGLDAGIFNLFWCSVQLFGEFIILSLLPCWQHKRKTLYNNKLPAVIIAVYLIYFSPISSRFGHAWNVHSRSTFFTSQRRGIVRTSNY